jgi:GGDEF domain-containing protein
LFPCSSEGEAVAFQERLTRILEEPIRLSAAEVSVGASVGSAFSANGRFSADELLQLADAAMYREKLSRVVIRQGTRPGQMMPPE